MRLANAPSGWLVKDAIEICEKTDI